MPESEQALRPERLAWLWRGCDIDTPRGLLYAALTAMREGWRWI